ncbi:unannotated protein [freshwater metagenome]|jgi:(R,R)-butanediol dehydrogenase/meso-butanediol dehydrogenase/diacetyl reductase|uniref:Unannotated protein n=1 Tax=freshwater metagenome TaxID=449393 RepID=A0A6J6T9M3_9ZZZZ|nr:2,3-butanediol dehydrogenase [Actinomycetota bacterium]MSZ57784.1 alcohol dehydrogenase catalytic domain-containing protein [Actinomycetota bacterium]
MKALTYYGRGDTGRGDFRIEDVPEPTVVPGTVKIDVEWCGICGSDLHEFEADTVSGYSPPVILGHEFAGTVSAVGDGVDHVRVGQRVAIEPFMYCQTCEFCITGDYHVCRDLSVVGVHNVGGGFAEQALVPAYTVHAMPDSVPFDIGALVEPITVGWHGMRKGNFGAGQTALVIGAGPIGLTTLLCAQAFDSAFTAVSVRRPGARADAAGRLGADAVIDSSSTDVVEAIMEMTKGRGVDVVFETSGAPEAMTTAVGAVRMGGTIVSLAVWLAPAPCDYMQVLLKELTIVGSKGYNKPDFPEAIAAIGDGRIRGAQEIITTRIGLDEVISGGFEVLADDRSSHVKILVSP